MTELNPFQDATEIEHQLLTKPCNFWNLFLREISTKYHKATQIHSAHTWEKESYTVTHSINVTGLDFL